MRFRFAAWRSRGDWRGPSSSSSDDVFLPRNLFPFQAASSSSNARCGDGQQGGVCTPQIWVTRRFHVPFVLVVFLACLGEFLEGAEKHETIPSIDVAIRSAAMPAHPRPAHRTCSRANGATSENKFNQCKQLQRQLSAVGHSTRARLSWNMETTRMRIGCSARVHVTSHSPPPAAVSLNDEG